MVMNKGESWVFQPGSIYRFNNVDRVSLWRKPAMLSQPSNLKKKVTDSLKTMFQRKLTSEPFVIDMYTATEDGAILYITSNEVAGRLEPVKLGEKEIIARAGVFYGSQIGVDFRVAHPFEGLKLFEMQKFFADAKKALYGPGIAFQSFKKISGDDILLLQIDGDIHKIELRNGLDDKGRPVKIDPQHLAAWESGVNYELTRFGGLVDRLLRGLIPYYIVMKGNGTVWYSDKGFSNGYWGLVASPTTWITNTVKSLGNMLGALNPFNYK